MSTVSFASRKVAWTVWIAVSIFYAYQYVLRVMPGVMPGHIMERFGMDAGTFGQFSGIYYVSYSLMHLPMGIFLDRFGPRKIMTLSILLIVPGLLSLIFFRDPIYPICGRFLIGLGSSAAILGVFKVVRMAFVEKRFARMLSFSVAIGVAGAVFGAKPVAQLLDRFGYEGVVRIFAAGAGILAFCTYFLIPEVPIPKEQTIKKSVLSVLKNGKVLQICLLAGLMVGPLEGFADVWGSMFFHQVYGWDLGAAGGITSLIFVGMCFGPVLSWIAEKSGDSFFTIFGSAVFMALVFVVLLFTVPSVVVVSALLFLVGIACAYQILAIYKASTYVPEEGAGLATAVTNMIIMVFGYVFHTLIGWTVASSGGVASSTALKTGICIIPLGLILGGIGFFRLRRKEKQALPVS